MNAIASPRLDVSARVGATCFVVPRALPEDRCRELQARALAEGFRSPSTAYPPSYRTNDRLVVDDPDLAVGLQRELAAHLPSTWQGDGGPSPVIAINERIRFCRYGEGQSFAIHRDGVFHRSADERSALTVMVYLNEDFRGGCTRFFAHQHADVPLWSYQPRLGSLIVFDHRLWHDGAPVEAGRKIVLRSDLMVRGPAASPPANQAGLGEPLEQHRGYVWRAVACPDGTILTSGRDRTLRRWGGEARHLQAAWPTEHASCRALAVDGEGRPWSGSRDGTIRRWRTDGEGPCWPAHQGAVVALCWYRGAMWSAGADGFLVRWPRPGHRGATLRGHRGWVWALAADDHALWSAGEDGTLRRWYRGGSEVVFRARSPLRSLARVGPNAVAVGAVDGSVRLLRGGRLVWRAEGHRGAVTALAALPDGGLLSGGEDGVVRQWHRGRPRLLRKHGDFVTDLLALDGAILSVGYDGARLR